MIKVFVQDELYRHLLFPAYREFHGRVNEETLKGRRAFLVEGDEDVVDTAEYLATLSVDILYMINHPSYADVTLSSPEDIVRYLIDSRGFKDARTVHAKMTRLTEDEKIEFLKLSIANKKWFYPYLRQQTKVYEIFEAFHLSSLPLLIRWYKLVPEYTIPRLYSSLLTFIIKLSSYTEIEASLPKWYRNILRMSHIQNLGIEKALDVMKFTNIPYSVLVPAFLLRSRKKQ